MGGTGGVAGAVQGTADVGEATDDGAGGLIAWGGGLTGSLCTRGDLTARECGRTASLSSRVV
jgi:hypothetical protein